MRERESVHTHTLTGVRIYYSCLKCGELFRRMDDVENHLEEKHEIFDQEEIDKCYLIHFP